MLTYPRKYLSAAIRYRGNFRGPSKKSPFQALLQHGHLHPLRLVRCRHGICQLDFRHPPEEAVREHGQDGEDRHTHLEDADLLDLRGHERASHPPLDFLLRLLRSSGQCLFQAFLNQQV